ncbi:hypothetical protein ACW9YV_11015 [Paraburkholderia strydomiana]
MTPNYQEDRSDHTYVATQHHLPDQLSSPKRLVTVTVTVTEIRTCTRTLKGKHPRV